MMPKVIVDIAQRGDENDDITDIADIREQRTLFDVAVDT